MDTKRAQPHARGADTTQVRHLHTHCLPRGLGLLAQSQLSCPKLSWQQALLCSADPGFCMEGFPGGSTPISKEGGKLALLCT